MLKVLLIGLLQIALGLGNGPTMEWKQSVEPADGADWTLVLEGKIAGGFYVHTMENKAIGVTLEIEPAAGLLLVGEPEEEFTPTDYKGETVATGTYILRQKFNYTGSRPLTLQGEVGWSSSAPSGPGAAVRRRKAPGRKACGRCSWRRFSGAS